MMLNPFAQSVQANLIIHNIGQLVTVAQQPITGAVGVLQVLEHAALVARDDTIVWLGFDKDMQELYQQAKGGTIYDTRVPENRGNVFDMVAIDAHGAVITPGFVDSHTHLVFAGDRAQEFHLRRGGISYGELLAQGHGILTTVQATRTAHMETLLALAQARLASMQSYGTTTVEVKTGYGLNMTSEEACLRIINQLNALKGDAAYPHTKMRVVPTFLGAHSVPPEYKGRRDEYVDVVIEEMLPAFVGLARFCDVFCEREAFTLNESRRILTRAAELGYRLKLHADQLSPSGGARLAAELGATSADHLDYASNADLDAMREAGVVATLLPGCSYTLRSPYPSARRFLEHGLTVALATDFNPGTSYCENMQTMMGLAMSAMEMSLEEALTAATLNGAKALALDEQIGSIEVGKRCELAVWSINDYHEIGYHFGGNLVQSILQR